MNVKFIDICAGIGGFHLGLEKNGFQCVGAIEKDKYARQTYALNFLNEHHAFDEKHFYHDLFELSGSALPDFDIMCAGFPCQPFSNAGKKNGFNDARGNVFFKLMEFVDAKKPQVLFLENVANLYKHDNGETFSIIKEQINQRGYTLYHQILRLSNFGLPQHRPRLYMIAFLNDKKQNFKFPVYTEKMLTLSEVFKQPCSRTIGFTLRVGGRGSGLNDRRNWDTYLVNEKAYRIGVEDAKAIQGFPLSYQFPVSTTQAMKQLGNSVSPQIISVLGQAIKKYLET